MDRLEMARELFNNPMWKAKNNNNKTVCVEGETISWEDDGDIVEMWLMQDETWEIIKPELRKMSFGEMYHEMIRIKLTEHAHLTVKSVVSGQYYMNAIDMASKSEILGEWTIEGYYE
jgi:hypothetical protein